MAEREGFEPPIRLPVCRISSAVRSTTLPPLRRPRRLAYLEHFWEKWNPVFASEVAAGDPPAPAPTGCHNRETRRLRRMTGRAVPYMMAASRANISGVERRLQSFCAGHTDQGSFAPEASRLDLAV